MVLLLAGLLLLRLLFIFLFLFGFLLRLLLLLVVLGVLVVHSDPLRKLLFLEFVSEDNLFDLPAEFLDAYFLLLTKLEFFGYVILTVVVIERYFIKVETLTRRQEHPHLFH